MAAGENQQRLQTVVATELHISVGPVTIERVTVFIDRMGVCGYLCANFVRAAHIDQ